MEGQWDIILQIDIGNPKTAFCSTRMVRGGDRDNDLLTACFLVRSSCFSLAKERQQAVAENIQEQRLSCKWSKAQETKQSCK